MEPLRLPQFEPDGENFKIDDILFKVLVGGDYSRAATDSDGVVLLKDWGFVKRQLDELRDLEIKRMVEFGLYQGGSAVLWPLIVPMEKYVGFDIQQMKFRFPTSVYNHPEFSKINLHWEISQDNRPEIEKIIASEFQEPLDLIVDDASHQYKFTKATFEICFPMLRYGGLYIIEDWAWSHWTPYQLATHEWSSNPALSNLVFELTMLAGSRMDIIPRMSILTNFIIVQRGYTELGRDFSIDKLTLNRGRSLQLV